MDADQFEQLKQTLVDGLNAELAEVSPTNPRAERNRDNIAKGYIVAVDKLAESLIATENPDYAPLGRQLIGFAQTYRNMTQD